MNILNYIHLLPLLTAVTFLEIFYSVFKVKWPDLYFAPSDQASYYISLSKKRFLLFRLTPVFISTFVVMGIFYKNGLTSPGVVDGFIVGILHGLRTHGLAFLKIIRNSKTIYHYFNKPSQLALHAFSFVSVVFISTLGAWISVNSQLQVLLPDLQGLVDNIWSALITLFLGGFMIRFYQNIKSNTDQILENSIKEIGSNLIEFIKNESIKYNSKYELVLAVCLVENIQRPLWFRKLEEIKSFFIKTGSYGIMQVKSSRKLNDQESVIEAIKTYFENTNDVSSDEELEEILIKYNTNPQYIDQVKDAYYHILSSQQSDKSL